MTYGASSSRDFAYDAPRGRTRTPAILPLLNAVTLIAVGAVACLRFLDAGPGPAPAPIEAPRKARVAAVAAPPTPHRAARLDPAFTAPVVTGGYAVTFAQTVRLDPGFQSRRAPETPAPAPVPVIEARIPSVPTVAAKSDEPTETAAIVLPLPPVRPLLATTEDAPPRISGRRRLTQMASRTPPPDRRSFFDKVFGTAPPPPAPALAYAAPEDGAVRLPAVASLGAPDRWTAVYDIAAHTVTLPDGTRLEAHSGLGSRLDDPHSVTEHMRGATPPNLYELTPREALFHGVRALRLTPIGGTTYGRAGLLAHTYMLGPRGDSNGCVVFRDYKAFRQAYDSGMVRRLAVVARGG